MWGREVGILRLRIDCKVLWVYIMSAWSSFPDRKENAYSRLSTGVRCNLSHFLQCRRIRHNRNILSRKWPSSIERVWNYSKIAVSLSLVQIISLTAAIIAFIGSQRDSHWGGTWAIIVCRRWKASTPTDLRSTLRRARTPAATGFMIPMPPTTRARTVIKRIMVVDVAVEVLQDDPYPCHWKYITQVWGYAAPSREHENAQP